MPREHIHPWPYQTSQATYSVAVGWSRGQHVQIATVAADADERLRGWVEIDDEASQPLDGKVVITEPGTRFNHLQGWYMDLDRAQINALIVLLRKARDQAYGRDA